jgi:hypothetical protein
MLLPLVVMVVLLLSLQPAVPIPVQRGARTRHVTTDEKD